MKAPTIFGRKHTMREEYFNHRKNVIDRKREIDKIIMEQELWLQKDNWQPVKVSIPPKKRVPLLKLLFEIRP